ncbi:MAG TPA: hypothetical protein DDZ21_12580 [Gammaproteobacteria bacterium]|nr:hypothetical protein [Gammaproteobacteria bacterium]
MGSMKSAAPSDRVSPGRLLVSFFWIDTGTNLNDKIKLSSIPSASVLFYFVMQSFSVRLVRRLMRAWWPSGLLLYLFAKMKRPADKEENSHRVFASI